jgi:hypothetical protein
MIKSFSDHPPASIAKSPRATRTAGPGRVHAVPRGVGSMAASAVGASAEEGSGLSEYEQFRLENIRRNEEMLRSLGISVSLVTSTASGRMAPTATTRRRRAVPRRGLRVDDGTERRSARNLDKKTPDYSEPKLQEEAQRGGAARSSAIGTEQKDDEPADDIPLTKRQKILHANRHAKPAAAAKSPNTRSCKNLSADLEGLYTKFLGEIIPPMGGQVKRAAMEAASAEGSPSFSRMSGIQEWQNAVCLFINVYGDGYKNVFLDKGKEVTWFAQPRQWEGTPVIQRMINSAGGVVTDDDGLAEEVEATPVLLFARNEGCGCEHGSMLPAVFVVATLLATLNCM